MKKIDISNIPQEEINPLLKKSGADVKIVGAMGQRYIAAGNEGAKIEIEGTPGNALGAYLNGSEITVRGNVQDAVGDTMNNGKIVVFGDAGDALGYAARGGRLYIRGKTGYRSGIHMKAYKDLKPVLFIGETAGSFLGEYLAGGIIAVLRLSNQSVACGNFPGTGMHGGKIFIRGNASNLPASLPKQVKTNEPTEAEMFEFLAYLKEYCTLFKLDYNKLSLDEYIVLKPDSANPYEQMYCPN
jgi:glutamate synthase domain-containing protein 3